MDTLDEIGAYTAMYQQFYNAVQASAVPLLGYMPSIDVPGKKQLASPDPGKHWLRFTKQNVDEQQSTLASHVEKPSGQRFTVDGLIIVQLFCPRIVETSFQEGMQIAEAVKNSFRKFSPTGAIWFYNARVRDGIEPEPAWHRFNVVVEFQYDQLS